jgi:hypothetical protein
MHSFMIYHDSMKPDFMEAILGAAPGAARAPAASPPVGERTAAGEAPRGPDGEELYFHRFTVFLEIVFNPW